MGWINRKQFVHFPLKALIFSKRGDLIEEFFRVKRNVHVSNQKN